MAWRAAGQLPTPAEWWHRVQAQAQGTFVWRWRVDQGPPPTDLTQRGGDDRAVSISLGFSGWPLQVTLWQRTQHGIAQAAADSHPLPRSVLTYVWGGTGREPAPFASPYLAGLGKVRVLRPAETPRGRWFEESVNLAAEWRQAFGGEPPPLQEIVISTDFDDTRSRLDA